MKAAYQEVTEAIIKDKTSSCKELLANALPDLDSSKVCTIVRSLNGKPRANHPNEALIHNDKTLTETKTKSNAFAQNYMNVRKLAMSEEDRQTSGPSVDD